MEFGLKMIKRKSKLITSTAMNSTWHFYKFSLTILGRFYNILVSGCKLLYLQTDIRDLYLYE